MIVNKLLNSQGLSLKSLVKNKQTYKIVDYPKQRDHVLRAFSNKHDFRISFVDTTNATLQSAQNFNVKDQKQIQLLSKCFSTSQLISSFLKGEERIKCVIQFDIEDQGHFDLYAESMALGEIRGFLKSSQEYSEQNKPTLLISQVLQNQTTERISSIDLDLNQEKDWVNYSGKELTKFYKKSDQITAFADLQSGFIGDQFRSIGCVIQTLPGGDPEQIQEIFETITQSKEWKECYDNQLKVSLLRDLMENKLGIKDMEFKRIPVDFFCRCKKTDFIHILKTLGLETIQDMKEKQQNSLICSHCNKSHILESQDFEYIINELNQTINPIINEQEKVENKNE